jgi:KaiC/GvpD/RAD55 family RecA-like ATPase
MASLGPPVLSQRHDKAGSHTHLVQFYDDERVLARNVSEYLLEGLRRGETVVVVATPGHRDAFTRELEKQMPDLARAIEDGHLLFLDAGETLAGFMVEGQPDAARFANTVGAVVRKLHDRAAETGLRAYGEMVDLLWNAGHSAAAMRLEALWNELLATKRFSLLCAYQVDVFGKEFQAGVLDGVLCAHTRMVSTAADGDLESAVNGAIEQVLGSRAQGLKLLIDANFRPAWAEIPAAEATVLWLRNNLPHYADEILARARGSYQAALAGNVS